VRENTVFFLLGLALIGIVVSAVGIVFLLVASRLGSLGVC